MKRHGLREACLGRDDDRVPPWLEKWAALILEFIEEEYRLLPDALQSNAQDSQPSATTVHVHEQAKGTIMVFLYHLPLSHTCVVCQASKKVVCKISQSRLIKYGCVCSRNVSRRDRRLSL